MKMDPQQAFHSLKPPARQAWAPFFMGRAAATKCLGVQFVLSVVELAI